jgi:hypothetical protein
MKNSRLVTTIILFLILPAGQAWSQQKRTGGENAALRYWTAFSEMQDAAISDEQGKQLNAILDGTTPYDDVKYKDLVEKNQFALDIMARGTDLPNCDWVLDYEMGSAIPVGYVWKARALGSLNILYVSHLLINGDKDTAVRALAAGIRFSRDVANGGSLVSALVAKHLLSAHLSAMAAILQAGGLSTAQRLTLQKAALQLGPVGLDWQSAARRDLESLRGHFPGDAGASAALTSIISAYVGALRDPSKLPALKDTIYKAPQPLADLIPNPKRVLEQKQELADKLHQTRSLFR